MKKIIKVIVCFLLVSVLLSGLFSCSDGKDNVGNEGEAPTITAPADVYLISLHSLMAGGISYYDYDTEGRLLSVTPVDPYTMSLTDDPTLSVKYTYSEEGKLVGMSYLSYPMELSFSDNGVPLEALYNGNDVELKIVFECYADGRIKKESVYNGEELFSVSEYGELGMLVKEKMELVGEAEHLYTADYSKTTYTFMYSDNMTYKIDTNELGKPVGMTMTSDKDTQYISWEYGDKGQCIKYTEKTEGSETVREHMYNSDSKLTETKVHYSGVDGLSYLLELIELSYDSEGRLASQKNTSYNSDGSLWNVDLKEYTDGLCTKQLKEEYGGGNILSAANETLTRYNAKGLVESNESITYDKDRKTVSRMVDTVEYDGMARLVKIESKTYGADDVYEGMSVEEYTYSENGGYKLTVSSYDSEGALVDSSEEYFEEE